MYNWLINWLGMPTATTGLGTGQQVAIYAAGVIGCVVTIHAADLLLDLIRQLLGRRFK